MKIALVFPPYSHKVFSENLSTVDEEFCLAPPIILAYVAAVLEKSGHKVLLLDIRALELSKQEALERLRTFGPDMLGFRAETYHFNEALEWLGYFRQHLGVPVISGGVNFDLYPYQTMSRREIDYGIIGEAIESLPALLLAIEDKHSLRDIPGVAYRDNDEVIVNAPRRDYVAFDSYPFPARHLLPNEKYYSFISQLKNFTIMLASTGCPFECVFCAIHPNTKYRLRSPENVVDEIEVCYRDFGVREIDFFDAVFFSQRARMLEIFSGMKKRRLKIEWSCRSRVDVVDEELLKEARGAGCRQIYFGIESAQPEVLSSIKKDITQQRVRQTIGLCNRYGIRTMGFFMVGNPNDTPEAVRRTMEFSKELGLDFIQVCRTIAKPGSALDKTMIDRAGIDYWREHVSGRSIRHRLPTPWSGLSEAQTESLTKEFYTKFYLRPSIIFKRIFQLKSFGEFFRYVKVAFKLILHRPAPEFHLITDTSEAEALLRQGRNYSQKARRLKTAVVIPTYNEKENIEKTVAAVMAELPQAHVVVVDDSSPDGTGAIAGRLAKENSRLHVINRKGKRGLGLAYKDGFRFVLDKLDADYIFQMDADFSHNPQYLPVFLHYAAEYDLVTGSRFMKTVSIKNRTIWRNMISKITKWAMNLFTGINLTDVTTGFKCFRKELLKLIDLKDIHAEGYAFQIEMSYAARHLGARIKEMPILFLERTAGDSKMSAGIMLEGFVTVLRLSFARLVSRPPLAPDNDAHNQWDRDFIAYFRCRPKKLRKGLAVLKKAGLLARDKDIRILELFCGMGECQQILAQRGYKNIFGLDISYDLIRRAAPGLRLQVANSLNVCYKDNVFDVVLVNEGLHHLKGAGEIRQCFGEVKKVLKKGGLFIFYEPADTIMRRLALKAVFSPIGGFFEKSRLIREILSKEEKEYGYWLKNTGPILKLLMDSGFDIERQFRTFIHMAVISKTADGL